MSVICECINFYVGVLLTLVLGVTTLKIDSSYIPAYQAGVRPIRLQQFCHGEYGPTLNWSPRTNYGCHKRSPPAIIGPGRTIRGNIYIPAISCIILRSRNVLAMYELPSSNENQMEFRYKHWCGRAERGRTRAPPCQRAKNINKKMKKNEQ